MEDMMKKVSSIFICSILIILFCFSAAFGGIFDKSEYAARRAKLMNLIPDGIAIIWGANTALNYHEYYQNNDFMYLTGVEIPHAVLIIDGMKKESILFFTTNERELRNHGIKTDVLKNPAEFIGIERVLPKGQFSSYLSRLSSQTDVFYTCFYPAELVRECSRETLRTLQRTMILNEWDGRLTRELQFVKLLNERLPQITVKDCSELIWSLRVIKSPAEIALMRKAGKIAVKAHIELMKATRPEMWEYELAALYEYYCKKEGTQDLAYYMIISSGPNHPYGHYYEHDRKLEDGDFLVIDVGPDYGYYDIDITISYPVNGKFTPRQKEIYTASNEIHKACMSLYKPGLTSQDVREKVAEMMKEKGINTFRMRGGTGHYVGMAVHDVGPRNIPLKPGMVFANEPGQSWPDEELGVRVEDTILVTEDGCENLTAGIPREIDEIEALMKKKGAVQVLKEAGLY